MSKVNLANVRVLEPNPSTTFFAPFRFEITVECYENLKEDLEFKLIYVGSAESSDYDQQLDTVLVGPMPEGRHMFVFEAPAPDPKQIPPSELVGVTVALLTCAYRQQEFVKVGYFVKNFYEDPEMQENPPPEPQVNKLHREIIVDEPRVTKCSIKWDDTQMETDQEETGETEAETSTSEISSTTPQSRSNGDHVHNEADAIAPN